MKHFIACMLLIVTAGVMRGEKALTVTLTEPGSLAAAIGENSTEIEELTVGGR